MFRIINGAFALTVVFGTWIQTATAADPEWYVRKDTWQETMRLSREGEFLAGRGTNGPFNLIRIRSAGPWGGAQAILRGGLVVRDRSKPVPAPLPN